MSKIKKYAVMEIWNGRPFWIIENCYLTEEEFSKWPDGDGGSVTYKLIMDNFIEVNEE